jgi:7-cyano-7-deazaguanine synthase
MSFYTIIGFRLRVLCEAFFVVLHKAFFDKEKALKALVLFSGGLDSSVCLGLAVQAYGPGEVLALSIYYGQKHKKEMEASEKVAAYYGVRRVTLDLGEIFKGSTCTLLEGAGEEIPHEEYAEQLSKTDGAPVSTYVPFRNGLFLSSAAAVAISHGCEVIYYGAHADDAAGNAYPDTSFAFNKAITDAIWLGSGEALRIEAPFINQTKAAVVAAGKKIGVPFELTWSCYEGRDKACGVCGTCRDRLRAFAENGLTDPIEYERTEES